MKNKRQQDPIPLDTSKPRYRSITDNLRRRLTEGSLIPGARLPALNDLAKQFKVSTTTIRNAIRVLEHEGCLYHVHSVGTFVRPSYPSPAGSKQTTVAFVTLDLGSPFDVGIARGIEASCQQHGWGIQIFDAHLKSDIDLRNLSRLQESHINGAVILPSCSEDSIEVLFKLKLSNFPFVLVDRGVPGLKVDLVESDHEKGAYQATEYFLKRGFSRVLMVTPEPIIASIEYRIRGYELALVDNGLDPKRSWKIWIDPEVARRGGEAGRRWLQGYEAIKPALDNLEKPLAVFSYDDYSGWGVYEACRERGLRIPQDVSIISFDDSDISQAMIPPMTAVAQRHNEIGNRAVELLERRLRSINVEAEYVVIDVDLIERQSVISSTAR